MGYSNNSNFISENIIEVRYKPNPKLLDYRGTWAEMISTYLELSEWKIVENRFDVFDKDKSKRIFVSFRNAGVVLQNCPTKNFLPDQTIKLFKFMLSQEAFRKDFFVERIGIRSRIAYKIAESFSGALLKFKEKFLNINESALAIINADLIDIGNLVNFKTKDGFMNLTSGPMEGQQIKNYFPLAKEFPETAFYIDIDNWTQPQKILDDKVLYKFFNDYSIRNWELSNSLFDLISKD